VVANTANLLSLDTVIIGGEYSVFNDTIIECISKITKSHYIFSAGGPAFGAGPPTPESWACLP
jgi:predicted NBD/HSP70 family sugar kinase